MRGRGPATGALKAVLFDLDDTLLDSFDARVMALAKAFAHCGIKAIDPADFMHGLRGGQLRDALARVAPCPDDQDRLFRAYRHAYWTKPPGLIKLYAGVRDVLARFDISGLLLGVVTQKTREFDVDGHPAGAAMELREKQLDAARHMIAEIGNVLGTRGDARPNETQPEKPLDSGA